MLDRITTNRLIGYAILAIAVIILLVIPEHLVFHEKYSVCMHKMILGIECSLCGMTRAAYELIHFRFFSAFQYNYNIFLLILFIVVDFIALIYPLNHTKLIRKIVLIILILGLVVLYLIRIGTYFGWF